ncbi:MAG: RNase adapter RapZ [Deltaproteobacteria bacterium]|nr:RNase adapter RapZ [Deltaproteobacteria bacterium]
MRVPTKKNEIVILSGLSGAGKSSALHVFEDLGYNAIDNLPGELLPQLAEMLKRSGSRQRYRKLALVMDARGSEFLNNLQKHLQLFRRTGLPLRILYLEARDSVLIRRFSETRRKHPLAPSGMVLRGIQRERKLLSPLRLQSSQNLDTSTLSVHQLRQRILDFVHQKKSIKKLVVNILSFGYRFGVPLEADLVLDIRFLPNPHFVPSLRPLSGENNRVLRFLLAKNETRLFIKHLKRMLRFLLTCYQKEGKSYLTLAFGCTGGRHRSVAIARKVAQQLKWEGYAVNMYHRDIVRGD